MANSFKSDPINKKNHNLKVMFFPKSVKVTPLSTEFQKATCKFGKIIQKHRIQLWQLRIRYKLILQREKISSRRSQNKGKIECK